MVLPPSRLAAVLVVVAALLTACAPDGSDVPGQLGPAVPPFRSPASAPFRLTPLAPIDYGTAMAVRPGHPELYLTEQLGTVRVLRPTGTDPQGQATYEIDPEPVVDLTEEMGGPERGSEAGLLGITFSPDGERLYLSDTQFQHDADRTFVNFQRRVLEFRMDGDAVDRSSRRTILDLQKNFSHHNSGEVRFGADGYLYVGIGDGSDSGLNDDRETGQDPTDLFGGILRVDPLDPPPGKPYAIPPDNPYRDAAEGAPEVWLFGTRNPWRFSFDRQTGDLWVSDVGEGSFEEINLLPAGEDGRAGAAANLGWSAMEGPEPFADRPRPPDALDPLLAYPHGDRCAVIGGYRYRGAALPALDGIYLFTDFCEGRLLGLTESEGELTGELDFRLDLGAAFPLSWGEDEQGEVYLLTSDTIYRLDP